MRHEGCGQGVRPRRQGEPGLEIIRRTFSCGFFSVEMLFKSEEWLMLCSKERALAGAWRTNADLKAPRHFDYILRIPLGVSAKVDA